jgi:hypothetical protein
MNNLFRGLIAGYGAKKLGGGCLGTVVVFILIWVALGQCSCKTIETKIDKQHRKPLVSETFSTKLLDPFAQPVDSF